LTCTGFPTGCHSRPALRNSINQFLLFRIDGDHGLVLFLQGNDLPADVLELSFTIWMRRSFLRLAIDL